MRRRAFLALTAGALTGCQALGGTDPAPNRRWPVDESVNPGTAHWPTPTGDARNARSVPSDDAPEPPLSVDWTEGITEYMGVAPPVVADDTVYASNLDTTLRAIGAADGKTDWTAAVDGIGAAVATDDSVVVGTDAREIASFDRADGADGWSASTSAEYSYLFPSAVAAADGVALAPTDVGLYAFDLATGDARWAYETGMAIGRHPAVADGTVYATGEDAYVHAIDAATGDREWWHKATGPLEAPPAVVDGTVYAAGRDGAVVALDAETGERAWRATVDLRVERLAVDGGFAYVGGNGGLIALRADDGERCWRFGRFDPSYAGGLAASPERIYATAEGQRRTDTTLVALDPETGGVEWRYEGGGRLTSGPAVVDGAVYAGGAVPEVGLAVARLS